MLLADFIREGTRSLGSLYPENEAHGIVMMLCGALLGTKSYTHIVEPGTVVEPRALAALEAAMGRLRDGEPVQYVLGFAEFCGFRFRVTPDVLIPRQETEQLVREAVEDAARLRRMRSPYGRGAAPVRVLDLCTGSGCIAWSVALMAPGTEVVGVDVSEGALSVANGQDFSKELSSRGAVRPVFVKADVLDTEQDFPYGPFDLILSNPPYLTDLERPLMHRNVLENEQSIGKCYVSAFICIAVDNLSCCSCGNRCCCSRSSCSRLYCGSCCLRSGSRLNSGSFAVGKLAADDSAAYS